MGQEYFINSQELQDKVAELLPSQGGAGAGLDLSASTQIVPIIDLTESAEGSNVRADLQTALSHSSVTAFSVVNTTSTIVNNTGYFRVFGTYSSQQRNPGGTVSFSISDGFSSKTIYTISMKSISTDTTYVGEYDFVVFLTAGDSLNATSTNTTDTLTGVTRQIADINGTLVDP
jgi:hypothetical protein